MNHHSFLRKVYTVRRLGNHLSFRLFKYARVLPSYLARHQSQDMRERSDSFQSLTLDPSCMSQIVISYGEVVSKFVDSDI